MRVTEQDSAVVLVNWWRPTRFCSVPLCVTMCRCSSSSPCLHVNGVIQLLPLRTHPHLSEVQCLWPVHISLITHSFTPPSPYLLLQLLFHLLLLLLSPSFVATTGKTTPTSASATYHGAAFPKKAGDPERGTGPDAPPPAWGHGSPDSEPISVEMEGKGEGSSSWVDLTLLGSRRRFLFLFKKIIIIRKNTL